MAKPQEKWCMNDGRSPCSCSECRPVTKTKPVKSDEELEYAEESVEALTGSVQSAGGTDELAGGLLALTGEATKLAILLGELNEDEWPLVANRLEGFLMMVGQIPTQPRKKRRIGFKPDPAPNRKARRKATEPKRKANRK